MEKHTFSSAQPLTTSLPEGSISWHRHRSNQINADLQYHSPIFHAPHIRSNPAVAIHQICDQEVTYMKAVLSKLRDKLAPQLAQQGQRTLVPRQWHNSEQRHWQKTDSAFLVAPAEFQLQESVSIPQEASEAAVLIDLVEQWISQREQNIRSLYQQVLQETGAGKSGNALASTEMG